VAASPSDRHVTECEVAIIGAGAAGIGAARRLAEHGIDALVLEARERVGGRATTVLTATGHPVDLGCEWLHSADRNPLTRIAREHGFTIDERLPDWGARLARSGIDPAEQAGWAGAREAFHARLAAAASATEDSPAAVQLEPGGRWNPLLQAISTWANGVELERLSVKDYAHYLDSGVNWRLREGYGTLFLRLADGLQIHLETPARHIDLRGPRIALETPRGALTARAVLVTVPPTLLAGEGAIRFTPPLPAAKLDAAQGLPLGLADKLFLAIDGPLPDLPPDSHVLGSTVRIATGGYELRPHGRPMIAAYFGGEAARGLESGGAEAMAAFAREELGALFGAAFAARLRWLASSAWAADPWARGSYSFALPGHAEDRAALAASIDGRLFFAGEACSPAYFSTAHGAFTSGIAAADEIAACRRHAAAFSKSSTGAGA
jgi:monoamine oxidase